MAVGLTDDDGGGGEYHGQEVEAEPDDNYEEVIFWRLVVFMVEGRWWLFLAFGCVWG